MKLYFEILESFLAKCVVGINQHWMPLVMIKYLKHSSPDYSKNRVRLNLRLERSRGHSYQQCKTFDHFWNSDNVHAFCLHSDLITECSCLFLDSSWSQRGLVWYWHPWDYIQQENTIDWHWMSIQFPSVRNVCVCVCVCVFASVMWPYVIWPLIFSLPFLLLLFFFPLIMPCHTGFLFLSLKQARYISNQPLWTWYNMCIKFTSPRSAYSCLLLIVQFSTQTLPLRKQLPVSLSTLINFILGWRNLVGCHLWGRTELDTTEAT